MNCEYFGSCGSCKSDLSYDEQLEIKKNLTIENFAEFGVKNLDIITSPHWHFRNRAEFRIWHDGDEINYAMNGTRKNEIVKIQNCLIVNQNIFALMPKMIEKIRNIEILREKLFAVEFLSSNLGEILLTLIYHKKVTDEFLVPARKLENELGIKIILRSRKIRVVVSEDFIDEKLKIFDKIYRYKIFENSFTQPNGAVNQKMIEWVKSNLGENRKDLIETYCGHGNFTIALSDKFDKVLATEISKTSIKSAILNCELNDVINTKFIRLSSSELSLAIDKTRIFRRLDGINLDSYNFSHIFIDPPRAGLDEESLNLAKRFDNIIYISCNQETLKRDLSKLLPDFKIEKFAIFDQFVYTHHIESGVILRKI